MQRDLVAILLQRSQYWHVIVDADNKLEAPSSF